MQKLTLKGVTEILCTLLSKNCNRRFLKKVIFAAFFTLTTNTLHAQQPALKPLSFGDTVPDININNIINYKTSSAKLSEFKGKLLILDFMNTYCLSCIAALPRLDSLQHEYRDNLQIFIVSNENEAKVDKFLKTNPIARNISIPVISEDSTLNKLFPHRFVSHEAWINKGIVKAITGSEYVKGKNVLSILSGITPKWEIKKDVGDYDFSEPLLTLNDNIRKYASNSNVYATVCTPHFKGVGVFYNDEVDSNTGIHRIRAINYSIAALYMQALTDWRSFTRSHVLLKSGDEHYFTYINKKEYYNVWSEKNTYCYEAAFPPLTPESVIRQKIKTDLDMYLQVKSSFEIRKTTCYVLVADSGFTPSSFPTGDYATLASKASKNDVVYMSPDDLVTMLNRTYWGTPFYNGLNSHLKIHIILPEGVLNDINILKTALKQQHLLLQKVVKKTNMLVIEKKQNNSFKKLQN